MEIVTVGGYSEVGKNMTALNLGDDSVIFDGGIYLPAIVELQEQEVQKQPHSEQKLRGIGALPDDLLLDSLGMRGKVRALLPSHAHLDHIGALPYLSYRYNAPIAATPFTISVLKKLIDDRETAIQNKMVSVQPNSSFIVKGLRRNYEAEFINMTHSTPQTAMIALHTPEGVVVYANDFKLDNNPVLGLPPNYQSLKRIAKEGVKALIIDSLYSYDERKTPSEKVARALLEEVMLTIDNKNSSIFVTTFSSHIARLKSIVEFSKKLNRRVYFIGRSLKKYTSAAIESSICPFKNDIYMGSYKKQVEAILKKVQKDRERSLVVCTGHQGEPGSVMDRLSKNKLPFEFKSNDNIIFSSKTIPVPVNIANKGQMDKRLKKSGVRIFDSVHVSGHAGREDSRDLITLLNPEHIIPSHGGLTVTTPMVELAQELGYRAGKNVHLMQNGQKLSI
ncbi:MBL fold metallo-hydrolase [Candidatus Pacearchaeota archaeon]|nr:MBL fold metallo-hydrolase [Candidatus Pacearchaeota archaeon]